MNQSEILTIYKNKTSAVSCYFIEDQSLFGIFFALIAYLKILFVPDKEEFVKMVPHHTFPYKFMMIDTINKKIVRLYLKKFFHRYLAKKKALLLWIKSPEYYYIRNFYNWDFLAFTYDTNTIDVLKEYPFYDLIYTKKLGFVYYINDKKKKEIIKSIDLSNDNPHNIIFDFIKSNKNSKIR